MTEKKYLLSLDEGTTSARAIIFDFGGTPLFVAQREFPQSYPKPGWVEQDPMELYATQSGVMSEVVAKSGISPAEIAAVGITNQRETVVVWDKKNGDAHCPRNRLAMPPHRCTLRVAYPRRLRGNDSPQNGAAAGCLFQRNKAFLDFGECSGRKRARKKRRTAFRHGGQLAFV